MKLYTVAYFFGGFTLKLEETYTHVPRTIGFLTDQVVYS